MTDEGSSATQLMRAVKSSPADPIAAILSAVLIILGALNVPERFDVSAHELAIILGAVGTIAATIRTWVIARRLP